MARTAPNANTKSHTTAAALKPPGAPSMANVRRRFALHPFRAVQAFSPISVGNGKTAGPHFSGSPEFMPAPAREIIFFPSFFYICFPSEQARIPGESPSPPAAGGKMVPYARLPAEQKNVSFLLNFRSSSARPIQPANECRNSQSSMARTPAHAPSRPRPFSRVYSASKKACSAPSIQASSASLPQARDFS